jgi:hypothetical protein
VTLGTDALPSLRRFYTGLGWTEVPGSDDNWAAYDNWAAHDRWEVDWAEGAVFGEGGEIVSFGG